MRCGRPLRPETGICPDVRPHRTKAIYQTVSACRDGMIFCSAIPILQAIARWHCHCHAAPNGQPQLRWGLGSSLCSCACKLLRMRVLPSHRVACATMIVVPQQSCSLRDATRGEDYCKARAHGCSDSMLNPSACMRGTEPQPPVNWSKHTYIAPFARRSSAGWSARAPYHNQANRSLMTSQKAQAPCPSTPVRPAV